MNSDMMTFPATVEEFMESYKIVDSDQVYTNGTELVPIFRMKQWFEHSKDMVEVVRCKDCKHCDITEVFDAKTAKSRQELFCMRYGMDIPGDWFCADGEKVTR